MGRERVRLLRRTACLLGALVMVASACGARLTEEQRAAGIGALAGGRTGENAAGPGGSLPGDDPGTDLGPGGTIPTGAAVPGVPDGGSLPPIPAGGNGGATDVGITANRITIAAIADVEGIQPGLFKSAHLGMQALVAYANSQGGVYGRFLKLLPIDDQTSAGGNKAAVVDACRKAFALVGSMSAFDDGGAADVDKCRIPDITAITTSLTRVRARYTYAVYPNRTDYFVIGSGDYIKQTHPGVVANAAQLYLNAGVTAVNAEAKRRAYAKIGYTWIYRQAVQVVETNYSSYVQAMKNHDPPVKYVTMTSDFQSIARLLEAMRKQNWFPEVLDWDSVAYDPDFISLAGVASENSLIYVNTAMFEEAAANPELQLFMQWLARVAPDADPDYFSLYAWSAGRLFLKLAQEAGPRLTRAKLMALLKAVHSWTSNGLHAAHDVGKKLPSNCTMYVRVQGGKFVRHAPASGFNCSSPLAPN